MVTHRWEGVKWRDTEINVLKKYFEIEKSIQELSSILNRSEMSIRMKARDLGLKRKIKTKTRGWKLSEQTKQKHKEHQLKDKNSNWKGNRVSYNALHQFIARYKPKPKLCEFCGKEKKLELASIDGKYTRNVNHYKWLCRGCHTELDIKLGFRKKDNKGRFIK